MCFPPVLKEGNGRSVLVVRLQKAFSVQFFFKCTKRHNVFQVHSTDLITIEPLLANLRKFTKPAKQTGIAGRPISAGALVLMPPHQRKSDPKTLMEPEHIS